MREDGWPVAYSAPAQSFDKFRGGRSGGGLFNVELQNPSTQPPQQNSSTQPPTSLNEMREELKTRPVQTYSAPVQSYDEFYGGDGEPGSLLMDRGPPQLFNVELQNPSTQPPQQKPSGCLGGCLAALCCCCTLDACF